MSLPSQCSKYRIVYIYIRVHTCTATVSTSTMQAGNLIHWGCPLLIWNLRRLGAFFSLLPPPSCLNATGFKQIEG